MDQAEKLRTLIRKTNIEETEQSKQDPNFPRVIAITSGKGGVGKSNLAVNVAICIARYGKRVIIIDADLGLANVEVLMGISPKYSFKDAIMQDVSFMDALTRGPLGVMFLSGGSAFTEFADISDAHMAKITRSFYDLGKEADVIILDTGAGISRSVTNFLRASNEVIVVTTSDPTSVTDAYALIKLCAENSIGASVFNVIVNLVEDSNEGKRVYERLKQVCSKFLNIEIRLLGIVLRDKYLARAVKEQEPVAISYPDSSSSRDIEKIARRLIDEPDVPKTGLKNFIDRLMGKI